jgi:hypothetical protein
MIEVSSGHNSVIIENRRHVYTNCSDHKDQRNLICVWPWPKKSSSAITSLSHKFSCIYIHNADYLQKRCLKKRYLFRSIDGRGVHVTTYFLSVRHGPVCSSNLWCWPLFNAQNWNGVVREVLLRCVSLWTFDENWHFSSTNISEEDKSGKWSLYSILCTDFRGL